jgi:hypothetical protein
VYDLAAPEVSIAWGSYAAPALSSPIATRSSDDDRRVDARARADGADQRRCRQAGESPREVSAYRAVVTVTANHLAGADTEVMRKKPSAAP